VDEPGRAGYAGCVVVRVVAALRVVVAVAAVFMVPEVALADGMQVEPGLWDVAYTRPDPLRGDTVTEHERLCVRDRLLTVERVNSRLSACHVSSALFHGPSVRWKMRCDTPAGEMTGGGSAKSNGREVAGSYEMSMALGSFEIPVSGAFRGHRVGDCR